MATVINKTNTKGFSTSEDICLTIKAPTRDPINVKGNNLDTKRKSTLPDLINEIVLVSDPIELANLLVAIAVDGGSPVNNRAGIEISPPPPTTESINEARKPAAIKKSKVYELISSTCIPPIK